MLVLCYFVMINLRRYEVILGLSGQRLNFISKGSMPLNQISNTGLLLTDLAFKISVLITRISELTKS